VKELETEEEKISAIYPRISKKDKMERRSFEAQTNHLIKFCNDSGRTIYKVYDKDKGRSATVKEDSLYIRMKETGLISIFELRKRPALLEMLHDASEGLFNEIIIFRWDRFSRNAIFQETALILLKSMGVTITPTDDSVTPLIRKITGNLSEEEISKLKSRINLSLRDKFIHGIIPSKMPYGYVWDKENKKVLLDDKKSVVVRRAFEMTLNDKRGQDICDELELPKKMYYKMIKNKVYYGVITFKGKTKKGTHQPIIDKKLFDDVTKVMEARKK